MNACPFEGAEKSNHEHQYRQGSGRKQDAGNDRYRIEKSRNGAQGEVVHGLFFEGEEKSGRGDRNGDDVYGGLGQKRLCIEVDARFLEVLQGEEMDNDGACIENKMGQNGVIERSGGCVNDSKKQSHGEDSSEFERRKVYGGKYEGLKNDGGSAFSEILSCHVGDESAEDVFLKNGGHEGQNE